MKLVPGLIWSLVVVASASACTKSTPPPSQPASATAVAPAPSPLPGQSAGGTASSSAQDPAVLLAEKGKAVYFANCTTCHNSDPHRPGTLGPDVWGSSLALLEARILRAEYPPGYDSKRKSKAMVALPHLRGDIPAIHAFLNAP